MSREYTPGIHPGIHPKRALANGVPGRFVSADELYGAKPWWRRAVDALGLWYVVDVPRNTYGWRRQPEWAVPSWSGRGRPATRAVSASKAQNVEALALAPSGLRFCPWKSFRVHDTQKGPEVWEFKVGRFRERSQAAPEKVQCLLIARHVRTGEVKYFLTNAPADIPLETLIRVAFSRWRIERCFQDCKGQLGLNHAELRIYRGLRRHLILTAVNYFFLQDWLLTHGGEKNRRI